MAILEFNNVQRKYHMGSAEWTLGPLSFSVNAGEEIAIMGTSGSGKSTLLHLAGTLDMPTSGEIYFDGTSLSSMSVKQVEHYRNREIGFVFQDFYLFPEFSLLDNVAIPLKIAQEPKSSWQDKAYQALKSVGLESKSRHLPHELSGGQRQRAAIARAIVHRPRLLLADEPTGNLDPKTGTKIIDLLKTIYEQEHMTFLIVTHDHAIADTMHRKIIIEDGQLASDSKTS